MAIIEYGELVRLSNRTLDIISDLTNQQIKVTDNLAALNNNVIVNGQFTLSSQIDTLSNKINNGIDNAINNLNYLNNFLKSQINSYKNLTEDANQKIKDFLGNLNSYLGSGNNTMNSIITPLSAGVSTATAINAFGATTGLRGNYTNTVKTWSRSTDECKNTAGIVTTNNQSYKIVPNSEYTGEAGTLPQSDYDYLVAIVVHEAGTDQSYDDMLGVATTVLNRAENSGDSIINVLKAGYLPWDGGISGNVNSPKVEDFLPNGVAYNNSIWQSKLEKSIAAVNDAINGTRNLSKSTVYFGGLGTHNQFSDILIS